jgi:hypothetical protein
LLLPLAVLDLLACWIHVMLAFLTHSKQAALIDYLRVRATCIRGKLRCCCEFGVRKDEFARVRRVVLLFVLFDIEDSGIILFGIEGEFA